MNRPHDRQLRHLTFGLESAGGEVRQGPTGRKRDHERDTIVIAVGEAERKEEVLAIAGPAQEAARTDR